MNIDELKLWREAVTYGYDNLPDISWKTEDDFRDVLGAFILAFVEGAYYAKDNPKSLD